MAKDDKYTLVYNYPIIEALVKTIKARVPSDELEWEEKCSAAVLRNWVDSKGMRDDIEYPFAGTKKKKITSAEACSLAWFIANKAEDIPIHSYLGNYLQNVFSEIYKKYAQYDNNGTQKLLRHPS
jgi:hypothetical protein